jgi:transcriptional regulator NrdR family protein
VVVRQKIVIKPGEIRCPRCRSKDLVASDRAGIRDAFMESFRRAPRHCRACGKRFYVLESELAAAETASKP